jgi:hypothetical protein
MVLVLKFGLKEYSKRKACLVRKKEIEDDIY